MADPDHILVAHVVVLILGGSVLAGLVLWFVVASFRDFIASIRYMQQGKRDLPAIIAQHHAENAQHDALLEIGFTEDELAGRHFVVADQNTGWPKVVYDISHSEIEARATTALRRRAQIHYFAIGMTPTNTT